VSPDGLREIDVTEAAPQKVFELLALALDCAITVDPAVKKAVTLRVFNTEVGSLARAESLEKDGWWREPLTLRDWGPPSLSGVRTEAIDERNPT
jgi:hypothetical protein